MSADMPRSRPAPLAGEQELLHHHLPIQPACFRSRRRVDQAIGLGQAQAMGIHALPDLANRIHHAGLSGGIPGQIQAHRRAGSILEAAGELHLAPVLPDRPAEAVLRLEQRP